MLLKWNFLVRTAENLPHHDSFTVHGGRSGDGVVRVLVTRKASYFLLVFAGLSLYFEDSHDDMDDCKYAGKTLLNVKKNV